MPKPYVFGGLHPYIETAAEGREVDPSLVGQSTGCWHAKQVQNTLGQLANIAANPEASPKALADAFAHAVGVASALIATSEACVKAISEAAGAFGVDVDDLDVFAQAAKDKKSALKLAADLKAARAEIASLTKSFEDANSKIDALKAMPTAKPSESTPNSSQSTPSAK